MKSVDSSLPVQTENKLGTEKISRLMLTTGVPLMLSLLINSLYNFVDSIFVSRVAEDALTALSLAAPVQMFVSALGFGNAIGLNATISKALGEKNSVKVTMVANSAIFIALCQWVFDRFVIASGKSQLFIFTLSAASITNIIFIN